MAREHRSPTPSVLVVGAGPTGLTLACDLARRGVPFRLIDSAPGAQPGSRGKGIQPRTLEVFDDLGVVDRVLAHGRMAMPMRVTGPDGRVTLVGGGDTPKPEPSVPYPASVITPQWRVEEALRERLAELGGGPVEFGTTLRGIGHTADGVSATVLDGDGAASSVTARWVVGCDGGHSMVRREAGIAFVGETRDDIRMIVADVAVEGLDRDAWHMWRHDEGMVNLCPLPSTALFQYQAGIAPGQDPDLGLANLQAILDRRSGGAGGRLREPEWSSLWRANVRLVDRYRAGRVFLAGDAAHIHSPAGGQGMNTGIQDAINLGWKLALADDAPSGLLDSYEAERRPIAAGVLALSDARLAQTLAQHGIPTRRDADTTQLGVTYRGSVLADDDRDDGATLRAGDRAPDASRLGTITGERRLFDLTRGGRFTLLRFGATAGDREHPVDVEAFRIVDRATGPHDVVDLDGHLARAYGATGRTLVLIRPDGYLGVISDRGDDSAVADYLVWWTATRPVAVPTPR